MEARRALSGRGTPLRSGALTRMARLLAASQVRARALTSPARMPGMRARCSRYSVSTSSSGPPYRKCPTYCPANCPEVVFSRSRWICSHERRSSAFSRASSPGVKPKRAARSASPSSPASARSVPPSGARAVRK